MKIHLTDRGQSAGCRIYRTKNPELRAAVEAIRDVWQPHQDQIDRLEQAAGNLPALVHEAPADADPFSTFSNTVRAGIETDNFDLEDAVHTLRDGLLAMEGPHIGARTDEGARHALNNIGSVYLMAVGRAIEDNLDRVLSHLNDRLQVVLRHYRSSNDPAQRDEEADAYQQLRDAQWACVSRLLGGGFDGWFTPREWATIGYTPDAEALWESPKAYAEALLARMPEAVTIHGAVPRWPHPVPAGRGNRPSDTQWLTWFTMNPDRDAWIPTITEMAQAQHRLAELKAAVRPTRPTKLMQSHRSIARRVA